VEGSCRAEETDSFLGVEEVGRPGSGNLYLLDLRSPVVEEAEVAVVALIDAPYRTSYYYLTYYSLPSLCLYL